MTNSHQRDAEYAPKFELLSFTKLSEQQKEIVLRAMLEYFICLPVRVCCE